MTRGLPFDSREMDRASHCIASRRVASRLVNRETRSRRGELNSAAELITSLFAGTNSLARHYFREEYPDAISNRYEWRRVIRDENT